MVSRASIFAVVLCTLPAIATAQRRHVVTESAGEVVATSQLGMSRATVRKLQVALRDAGCDPGATDGVIGAQTRRAIACVQAQANFAGSASDRLLREMAPGTIGAPAAAGSTVFPTMPLGVNPATAPPPTVSPARGTSMTLTTPAAPPAPGRPPMGYMAPTVAPSAPAAPSGVGTTRTPVTVGIPVPTTNSSADSVNRGVNSAHDSTNTAAGARRVAPVRPDTTRPPR